MSGRASSLVRAAIVVALAACQPPVAPRPAPPPPAASAPQAKGDCEAAEIARADAETFEREGRLDRTIRVVAKADRSCPASAPRSWALAVATLSELGRYDEARALASTIEAAADAPEAARAAAKAARDTIAKRDRTFPTTDEAKREMRGLYVKAAQAAARGEHAAAKDFYLAAWEAWRPNGQALVGAGTAAKALGRKEEAQRLFDRAVVELEKATGKRLVLDAPDGLTDAPSAIAWSPSAALLAVAHGSTVSLIDGVTFRERSRLVGSGLKIAALAFSPDGSRLATGSLDAIVRIWDIASGEEALALRGHLHGVTALAFTPDGNRLVSAADDVNIKVWSLPDGAELRTLEGHSGTVRRLAISPDGARVASASADRSVRLWDLATGKSIAVGAGHATAVGSVVFGGDGKTLVSMSDDGEVRRWDGVTGAARSNTAGSSKGVRVALSPGGAFGATGARDGEVVVGTKGKPRRLAAVGSEVTSLAFSPGDARWLAVGTSDRAVRLSSEALTVRLGRHTAPVAAIAFARDGRLAIGAADGTVRFVGDAKALLRTARRAASITSLALASDGARVAAGMSNGEVAVLDGELAPVRVLFALGAAGASGATVPLGGVLSLAWSPDGARIATGWSTRNVTVVDAASGKLELTLEGHGGPIRGLAFSPDGARIASASDDKMGGLWDARSGDALKKLQGHSSGVASIAYSPDAKRLLTASADGSAGIWDAESGDGLSTLEGHDKPVSSAAWSPDGKRIATGSGSLLRLFGVERGELIAKLAGHEGEVTSVVFAPSGAVVASGSRDGSVAFWAGGARIASLRSIADKDAAYVMSPEGDVELLGADVQAAEDVLLCRVGPLSYRFEVCAERFLSPGLLARALRGER